MYIYTNMFIINFTDVNDVSIQFTNNKISNICKIYNHIYSTLFTNFMWPADLKPLR